MPAIKEKKVIKNRGGRPAFKPTVDQRDTVLMCAAFGVPEREITAVVKDKRNKPIGIKTLRKYFRQELDGGKRRATIKVVGALFKNATTPTAVYPGGVPGAQMFWLKCQDRWQQNPHLSNVPPPPPLAMPGADGTLGGSHEQAPADDEATLNEIGRRIAWALAKGLKATKQPA